MLFDAKGQQATVENARNLIENRLPELTPPRHSYAVLQVLFAQQSNGMFDFFNVFETDEPQLVPEQFKFCLHWQSQGWSIVSEEQFAEIYADSKKG